MEISKADTISSTDDSREQSMQPVPASSLLLDGRLLSSRLLNAVVGRINEQLIKHTELLRRKLTKEKRQLYQQKYDKYHQLKTVLQNPATPEREYIHCIDFFVKHFKLNVSEIVGEVTPTHPRASSASHTITNDSDEDEEESGSPDSQLIKKESKVFDFDQAVVADTVKDLSSSRRVFSHVEIVLGRQPRNSSHKEKISTIDSEHKDDPTESDEGEEEKLEEISSLHNRVDHGRLKSLFGKHESEISGYYYYDVLWEDGTKTQETPRDLARINPGYISIMKSFDVDNGYEFSLGPGVIRKPRIGDQINVSRKKRLMKARSKAGDEGDKREFFPKQSASKRRNMLKTIIRNTGIENNEFDNISQSTDFSASSEESDDTGGKRRSMRIKSSSKKIKTEISLSDNIPSRSSSVGGESADTTSRREVSRKRQQVAALPKRKWGDGVTGHVAVKRARDEPGTKEEPELIFKRNPRYTDEFIAAHRKWCNKCDKGGAFFGVTPRPQPGEGKKRQKKMRRRASNDDAFQSMDEEELGMLLLCEGCSTVMHEACIPRDLRTRKGDRLGFWCLPCLKGTVCKKCGGPVEEVEIKVEKKVDSKFEPKKPQNQDSEFEDSIIIVERDPLPMGRSPRRKILANRNTNSPKRTLPQPRPSIEPKDDNVGIKDTSVEPQSGVIKLESKDSLMIDTTSTASTADADKLLSEPPLKRNDPLFRCIRCMTPYHWRCLPPVPNEEKELEDSVIDEHERDCLRRTTCIKDWKCGICLTWPEDVDSILTFRETSIPNEKEFLVKWRNQSYRHLSWVPEFWLQNVFKQRYQNFVKLETQQIPFEKAFSKEWTHIDRILDVEYKPQKKKSRVRGKGKGRSRLNYSDNSDSQMDEDSDIEGIDRVLNVFAKWKDLGYDEVTWDTPPSSESDTYEDFKNAYKRYLMSQKIFAPTHNSQKRKPKFVELEQQPDVIKGGELMKHQMEGLNWLLFQYSKDKPSILADDMGLGKTIQIISFCAYITYTQKVFPFLIIVPNSTAVNWVCEFSKWAPDLYVVPFFGEKDSRAIIKTYEICHPPPNENILKCHVVITTYDTASTEIGVLNKYRWPVMVVDEGQRLKNDAALLFRNLKELDVGHRILLTGTPLQNNIRELFNLMNFLDPENFNDPKSLEIKYGNGELTKDSIRELHELLRPYFLRRTKGMVLHSLPPKAEIIVPVSMSPLQREIGRAILGKNADLLKTILNIGHSQALSKTKRTMTLNNILIEMRKNLNHPYLIEGTEPDLPDEQIAHQRLIDAAGKLKLLDAILKKIKTQGHRVLIFSTMKLALDVIEDYLVGEDIRYLRLDGDTKTPKRQKDIDAFNAPGSPYFVYLLTTRAGGVGVNLASADTVIIYDPDFNPHADMQALSRAHRIGQTKKVLVLKFMTRDSPEEKIFQIAKKKMMLDHLIVAKMDDENLEAGDVETMLKYGAKQLFENDAEIKEIKYDDAALEKLLDRTHIEIDNTTEEEAMDNGKNLSFSFAKMWTLEDGLEDIEDIETQNDETDQSFWEEHIKKIERRENITEVLGKGGRRRTTVKYIEPTLTEVDSNFNKKKKKTTRLKKDSDSEDGGEFIPVAEELAQSDSEESNSTLSSGEIDGENGKHSNKLNPDLARGGTTDATSLKPNFSMVHVNNLATIANTVNKPLPNSPSRSPQFCLLCSGLTHTIDSCAQRSNISLIQHRLQQLENSTFKPEETTIYRKSLMSVLYEQNPQLAAAMQNHQQSQQPILLCNYCGDHMHASGDCPRQMPAEKPLLKNHAVHLSPSPTKDVNHPHSTSSQNSQTTLNTTNQKGSFMKTNLSSFGVITPLSRTSPSNRPAPIQRQLAPAPAGYRPSLTNPVINPVTDIQRAPPAIAPRLAPAPTRPILQPRPPVQSRRTTLQSCFICKQLGHDEKDCPERQDLRLLLKCMKEFDGTSNILDKKRLQSIVAAHIVLHPDFEGHSKEQEKAQSTVVKAVTQDNDLGTSRGIVSSITSSAPSIPMPTPNSLLFNSGAVSFIEMASRSLQPLRANKQGHSTQYNAVDGLRLLAESQTSQQTSETGMGRAANFGQKNVSSRTRKPRGRPRGRPGKLPSFSQSLLAPTSVSAPAPSALDTASVPASVPVPAPAPASAPTLDLSPALGLSPSLGPSLSPGPSHISALTPPSSAPAPVSPSSLSSAPASTPISVPTPVHASGNSTTTLSMTASMISKASKTID